MSAETVADLLAASRAKHAHYRSVSSSRNIPMLQSIISAALTLRVAAHVLDPDHVDSAWESDQAGNRGIPHADMVTFYERYLRTP